jgi:hypothetical protein
VKHSSIEGNSESEPSYWIIAKIFALSAAEWWESQLDPWDRLQFLYDAYRRLRGRRRRRVGEIYDRRDIAKYLEPLVVDYFDRATVLDWFRKKPDPTNQNEMEAWQLDALSITMRFDPFPEDAANAQGCGGV